MYSSIRGPNGKDDARTLLPPSHQVNIPGAATEGRSFSSEETHLRLHPNTLKILETHIPLACSVLALIL
jgi:hypothetical protein